MIKIDIISGFLGAGKTTLIQKLLKEAYAGEKVVLIENEFGEIGVDGGFLKEAGIEITEMNSGCICCSLVGDFSKALVEVAEKFSPERIVIEPSGVGKLSDVIKAVLRANVPESKLNAFCTVVDAKKCKAYLKNFGEFFLDQVENASCIVLSHNSDPAKVEEAVSLLREHTNTTIVTTVWEMLNGKDILAAMQRSDSLEAELLRLEQEAEDDDDEECDDPECECHHHHDGDEHEQLEGALSALASGEYGEILRAKGIVAGNGVWYYFDYVPGETDIRTGAPIVTGRLCVIGCKLDEAKLKALLLG